MNDHNTAGQPQRAESVHHLRQMAAARVESTSLRAAAREIGMSPTGLKKFLLGTDPYSPTVRRLRSWYVQHAAHATGALSRHDASASLTILTRDLPADARDATGLRLLDCLSQSYDAAGRGRPGWLVELAAVSPGERAG